MKKSLLTVASGLSLHVAGAGVAYAQQSLPEAQAPVGDATAPAPAPAIGDDIVVTAQRRSESVQKIPIAVTAIEGSALRDSGKADFDAALRSTPGVQIANSPAAPQVFIRGVGPAVTTDASVSLNFDGMYQSDGIAGRFYDMARVEVLRGPQGTLYGRNSTAGSVNFVSNAPTLGDVKGFGLVQIGNYAGLRTEGMLNVPVTSTVALRGSFATSRHDGYFSNGGSAEDFWSARLKLLYQPSDAVKLVVTGMYTHGGGTPAGTVTLPVSSADPYRSTVNPGATKIRRKEVYAQLDVNIGFATLTWLPGYYDDFNAFDQEPLGRGLTAGGGSGKQHTEELRLVSNPSSAIKWVIGGFYLNRELGRNRRADALAAGARSPLTYPFVDTTNYSYTSKAVFGQITLPLADTFRLTGGLRYSRDDRNILAQAFTNATTVSTTVPAVSAAGADEAVNWKAGLEFDVAPRSLLYAQVSTGYKSGGINEARTALVGGKIAAPTSYAPEHVTAYEAGLKNRFGPVTLNLSGFYYDYTNQQVLNTIAGAVVIRQVVNAAKSTIWGLEADAQFRAGRNTRLYGNVTYLNSKYDNFSYFNQLNPVFVPGAGTTLDYSGRRGLNAPKWVGLAGLEQTIRIGDGSLTASGEMHFSSRYYVGLEPTPLNVQPAFTQSDARITYKTPDARWAITAFINNIENEPLRVFTLFSGPATNLAQRVTLAPPRTFGASVSFAF